MPRIVEEVERGYFDHNPAERALLSCFLPDFDVTWANRKWSFGSELSVFLLKPEKHMEKAFGFESEIMAVYSKYDVLESRTVQSIEWFISQDPARGRVDTMTVFLISEAPDPVTWARQYMTSNPESRLIVAFSASELRTKVPDVWQIRSKLAAQLYQRDLFDHRLPIKNDFFFFGREDLLFDLYNAFKRSENRGIFGLRKTGKTSLLFKLERKVALSNDGLFVYVDCKLPPVRNLSWERLLLRIAKEISYRLKLASTHELEEPADAFMSVIAEAVAASKVVLVFDEIEFLSPFSSIDDHWRKDFIPFWQTIWACQSRHSNLSVIVAGVNPTVVEKDLVLGVQNPLFGIVPPQYLHGLRKEEVQRMVRTLGKPMGLRITAEAVSYLFSRYGGHPLLTRIACSLMHKEIMRAKPDLPFDVNPSHLLESEESRDNELSFYCRHIVSELSQFYPDEYALLERIASGQLADYVEFLKEAAFTTHLTNYGLIDKDNSGRPRISISAVAKFLGLEAARRENRKTILKVIESSARGNWLKERVDAINSNLETLQRAISANKYPPLFGALSYPESHKFFGLSVCAIENDFALFINTLNRCFVESI